MFEKQTGLTVKTISVGTGQALALAARGEADVTLAHAPGLEKKYVDEGKMTQPPPRHVQRLHHHRPAPTIPRRSRGCRRRRRAEAHRGEPVALRLPRGQIGHARARAGAVEAGGRRAEGRLVHRVRAGNGADARHRQRPARLHARRPRHVARVPEAGRPAHPGGEGPPAAEHLLGDGGESGERAARQRQRAARPSRTSCCRPRPRR